MSYPSLDRERLSFKPLESRKNKIVIERDHVPIDQPPGALDDATRSTLSAIAHRIRAARQAGAPVVLAFGAHTIKNGLGPVLAELMCRGWLTHLATNGAGIIHDWEFAWLGQSSEDVQAGVTAGEFGNWEETGRYINLALVLGAFEGRGYGESVGAMIEHEGLRIPAEDELREIVARELERVPLRAAAAADLLDRIRRFGLPPGRMEIPHRWKRFSAQATACRLGIPFTGHPMIGHDIIYNHPMNLGAAIGRAAERDFLGFAHTVSRLEGGVYLSIGSAVMSPMVFEKSLSMARNLAHREGRRIEDFEMLVADLAPAGWDWSRGEPPEGNAEYYLRYKKTFSRMGGRLRTVSCDNRDVLLTLLHELPGEADATQPSDQGATPA